MHALLSVTPTNQFSGTNISQSRVATFLSGVGIFNNCFIANFPLSVPLNCKNRPVFDDVMSEI